MRDPNTGFVPLHGPIEFTPKIRKIFREKRHSLCLGYAHLGAIFNLHWTTVRNWETGRVTHCHRKNLKLLRGFLLGELDARISAQLTMDLQQQEISDQLVYQVLLNYQKISLEYLDCQTSANSQEECGVFLTELDAMLNSL